MTQANALSQEPVAVHEARTAVQRGEELRVQRLREMDLRGGRIRGGHRGQLGDGVRTGSGASEERREEDEDPGRAVAPSMGRGKVSACGGGGRKTDVLYAVICVGVCGPGV